MYLDAIFLFYGNSGHNGCRRYYFDSNKSHDTFDVFNFCNMYCTVLERPASSDVLELAVSVRRSCM